jgi:hypothetical protein
MSCISAIAVNDLPIDPISKSDEVVIGARVSRLPYPCAKSFTTRSRSVIPMTMPGMGGRADSARSMARRAGSNRPMDAGARTNASAENALTIVPASRRRRLIAALPRDRRRFA